MQNQRDEEYKCLMITTKDNRKFFTHEKNYGQLIEFSKTFNADVSVVRAENAEVLDLMALAPALCDVNYKPPKSNFEIIEQKIKAKKRTRKNLLNNAQKIKNYIRDSFLSGDMISLKDISKKFKKYNLTLACYCNHLSTVRKQLEREGHKIVKVGGGKYKINGKH